MKEKIQKIVNNVSERDFESFKKNLFLVVSEKVEIALSVMKENNFRGILEAATGSPDQDKANAELTKADAEKQALFVDPMMAKEFFLFDIEYKGHTITVKSLGTGIGKPLVSYIDGQKFEIFTDKEIATKESKQAIDRMIKKGLTDINDLRKTPERLKAEQQEREKIEKMKMMAMKQETEKKNK